MIGRRRFLALSAVSAGAAACEGARGTAARWLGASWPARVAVPGTASIDPAHHLLDRAAFGPWPGDRERVRELGVEGWIDWQLHPDDIDDSACRALARRFESIQASPGETTSTRHAQLQEELARYSLLQATFTRRQLHESMVALWGDHFNIAVAKGDVVYFKATDERAVIRAHALGRFRDLVRASALSPAMLVYLDGADNRAGPGEVPNENYARELLELHTLGVSGGYEQRDVMEAARALSGWRVAGEDDWGRGRVIFDRSHHDDGTKQVLGRTLAAGAGADDLDALLDVVCTHPSTARFVATKLCRWFIADDPPDGVVDAVSTVFSDTDGDLAACVRATLLHPAFAASVGGKIKRPFRLVVSALRGLGAVHHARPPLVRFLERMGQDHGGHPTPDGYPWEPHPWLGTLAWRWSFARQIADGGVGAQVPWEAIQRALPEPDALWAHLVGRAPLDLETRVLRSMPGDPWRETAALAIASPAFQVH